MDMRSLLSHSSSHSAAALVARTVGVALLTPLILLAGLVAVVALTAAALSRRSVQRAPAARPATARPLVLRLHPAPAESGLGSAGQRAA
jgi:hypothetical protein